MQKKSIEVIAYETANGMYGVGKDRERNLKLMGYNPNRVQKLVNRYLRYGFPVGLSEQSKMYRYQSRNQILGDSYSVDDLIYIIKKKGYSIKDDALDNLKNRIEKSINDGKTNLGNLISYIESKADDLSAEDLYKLIEKDIGESEDKIEEMLSNFDAGTSLSADELKDIIKYVNAPEDIDDVIDMVGDISDPDAVDFVQGIQEKAQKSFQDGITTPKKLGNIVDYCKENGYSKEEILAIIDNELDGVQTEEGKEAERIEREKDTNGNGIPNSVERLNQEIDNTDEVPIPDGAVTGDNNQANKVPVSYNYPNGTNNPNPNNLITCYIRNMITDEVIKFPTIPTELSESYQTNYSSTDINGRSAPYQTYGGNAARSLSYNVKLYEDLCAGEYGSMGDIVRKLKSLVYPRYNGSIVIPPYCFLKFGDMVTCYAIMESISFSWGEVILEGKGNFASCDVDFSFQELRVDKIPTADTVFPDREA